MEHAPTLLTDTFILGSWVALLGLIGLIERGWRNHKRR